MTPKMKAVPLDDSDEEDLFNEKTEKRVKLIRELSRLENQPKKLSGGIKFNPDSETSAISTSESMSATEKKGMQVVAELQRELDLENTFSKETNRRDEDAEMNKYIDEELKSHRERANKERNKLMNKTASEVKEADDEAANLFTIPGEATDKIDDILLHSLSKNMAASTDEKSEAMLSSQMLNGIPEVDLGIDERIRTIEATEEAKWRLASGRSSSHRSSRQDSRNAISAPINHSSNFQQHRRDNARKDNTTGQGSSRHADNDPKTVVEPVVRIGEEPDEVEFSLPKTGPRVPVRGKATDDYYLSKFKKNLRK